MFNLLERLFGKPVSRSYYVPEKVRVYAVGDIHGRADLLEAVNQRILAHAAGASDAKNIVVYLGDYVDRGIHIRKTLDILLQGLPGDFRTVYLKGNHEDTMIRFLEDSLLLEPWLNMGGQATLMNYGITAAGSDLRFDRALKVQDALLEAIPEDHLAFLCSLENSYELGDYFFAHAGIRPGVELSRQNVQDLFWIRDDFLSCPDHFGARIVHGHSIVTRPQVLPNRISLDTGAYATGILSCAVLEKDRVQLLDS